MRPLRIHRRRGCSGSRARGAGRQRRRRRDPHARCDQPAERRDTDRGLSSDSIRIQLRGRAAPGGVRPRSARARRRRSARCSASKRAGLRDRCGRAGNGSERSRRARLLSTSRRSPPFPTRSSTSQPTLRMPADERPRRAPTGWVAPRGLAGASRAHRPGAEADGALGKAIPPLARLHHAASGSASSATRITARDSGTTSWTERASTAARLSPATVAAAPVSCFSISPVARDAKALRRCRAAPQITRERWSERVRRYVRHRSHSTTWSGRSSGSRSAPTALSDGPRASTNGSPVSPGSRSPSTAIPERRYGYAFGGEAGSPRLPPGPRRGHQRVG